MVAHRRTNRRPTRRVSPNQLEALQPIDLRDAAAHDAARVAVDDPPRALTPCFRSAVDEGVERKVDRLARDPADQLARRQVLILVTLRLAEQEQLVSVPANGLEIQG